MRNRRFVSLIFALSLTMFGFSCATASKIHTATTQTLETIGQVSGTVAAVSPPGSPMQFWAGIVAAVAGTMLAVDHMLTPLIGSIASRFKKDTSAVPTAGVGASANGNGLPSLQPPKS